MENYNKVESTAFIRKLAKDVRENLDKDYPTYKFTIICNSNAILVYIDKSNLFIEINTEHSPLIYNNNQYQTNPLFKGDEYKLINRIRELLMDCGIAYRISDYAYEIDIKIGGVFKPHKYKIIN